MAVGSALAGAVALWGSFVGALWSGLWAGLVGVAVGVPAVYLGVPLSPADEPIPYREAVAVALLGVTLSGAAAALLGWLPIVGLLVAPAVWVGVVKRYCPVDWGVAAVVGGVSWAMPVVLLTGARLLS